VPIRDEMIDNYKSQSLARKDPELINEWLSEPTEPQLVDGEWRSVYRMNISKCESLIPLYSR
jgi:hypothetical protein